MRILWETLGRTRILRFLLISGVLMPLLALLATESSAHALAQQAPQPQTQPSAPGPTSSPAATTPAPVTSPATPPTATPSQPTPVPAPVAAANVLANYVVPASRAARDLAVITIEGQIDSRGLMHRSIQRRIDDAVRDGADAIIFEINTPGGEANHTRRICEAIKSSPLQNTVAWVRPQAISGGALIALAAREMIVAYPASMGDAMPVMLRATGPAAVVDSELLKKALPPLLTEILDSARQFNNRAGAYVRDEYLCQAIVANDVELWWVQHNTTGVRMAVDAAEFALLFPGVNTEGPTRLPSAPGTGALQLPPPQPAQLNITVPSGSAKMALAAPAINVTTPSMRPLLTSADVGAWTLLGKIKDNTLPATFSADDMSYYQLASNPINSAGTGPVPINSDSDLKSFFGASNLQRYETSWSEHLVALLTSRIVQGILVVIFLIALFVEMSHPGAIFPAIISLIALICLIAPSALIGMALWWEVVAIFLGVLLVGVEILVLPGLGVAGIGGLILLFVGLIGLFVPGNTGPFPDSAQSRDDMAGAAVTLLLSFGTAGLGMFFIARHFGSIPLLGKLVLKPVGTDDESSGSMLAAMQEESLLHPVTIGQRGTALTPMRPAGRIQVGDHVIDAVAEFGFINSGTPVKITSVSAMRIGVEEVV
jgi:membrane-bound ClpP family serine protease